jgi:hypothetical protein
LKKYLAFFLFVVPGFFAAIGNFNLWPFSNYEMYSQRWEKTDVHDYELFGYSADGRSFTIQQEHTHPLSRPCWVDKFDWIKKKRPQDLNAALFYILESCNAFEGAKNSEWPPLVKIKMREGLYSYDDNWDLIPDKTRILNEHEVYAEE